MKELCGQVYEADPLFKNNLVREIENYDEQWGQLFWKKDAPLYPVYWQRNIWKKPFIFEFDTISNAVGVLRSIQRNWTPSLFCCFRRGALISGKLPPISCKPKKFPWRMPDNPMGAWTLLDKNTLLGSAECESPFPGGIIEFEQNRIDPPSRAYLKLWESFVRCRAMPKAGEKCFDAGASPGGWSWVLAGLGADVTACDRAELDGGVSGLPNVRFIKHDAFTLKPEEVGSMDWVFSDVVCYPPRLFEWVEKWLESGLCGNFICTIKMQGETDFETTRRFASIPDSRIVHLYHNKHELTWVYIKNHREHG